MPTIDSDLTSFSEDTAAGSIHWRPSKMADAQASDDVRADVNPYPAGTYVTYYLKGQNLVSKPTGNGTLTALRVLVEARADGAVTIVNFEHVYLVSAAGTILTAIDLAAGDAITILDAVYTFSLTAANLATLGVVYADLKSVLFGVVASFNSTDMLGVSAPEVDQIKIQADYNPLSPVGTPSGSLVRRHAPTQPL